MKEAGWLDSQVWNYFHTCSPEMQNSANISKLPTSKIDQLTEYVKVYFPWQLQVLGFQSCEANSWNSLKHTSVPPYLATHLQIVFYIWKENEEKRLLTNNHWNDILVSCYVLLSCFNKLNYEHNSMLLKMKVHMAVSSQSSNKSASLCYFKSIKS